MTSFTGDGWETLMEGYLKDFGDKESVDSEISSLFSRLSKTLEKKSLFYWHVKSFQDYIKEDINPAGLRVQIFPTLEGLDSEFKSKWEHALRACSQRLMEILIEEYKKRSNILDSDIVILCNKLQQLKTQRSLTNKEDRLKTHLETFNKDVLIKKRQKLIRDRNAFKDGRAYRWTQNRTNQNRNYQYQGYQTNPSQTTPNPPQTHTQTLQKPNTGHSTKRTFRGDPNEGQQAKKLTLDIPKKTHPPTATQEPTSKTYAQSNTHTPIRDMNSQSNPSTVTTLDTISNDPSFLEKILMGVQPTQSNPNTYTQIAL